MTTSDWKPRFVYFAIQRFKPHRAWPNLNASYSKGFEAGTIKGAYQIDVSSYDAVDTAKLAASHTLWAYRQWDPDLIGTKFVFPEREKTQSDLSRLIVHANPGELDVTCSVLADAELGWAFPLLKSMFQVTLATLSLSFRDTFLPLTHLAMEQRRTDEPPRHINSPTFSGEVRAKPALTHETVSSALAEALRPYVELGTWGTKLLL